MKPIQQRSSVEIRSQYLDGDLFAKELVRAHGEEDHAHTALADFADDLVDPQTPADPIGKDIGHRCERRAVQKGSGPIVGRQQAFQFEPERLVVGTRRFDKTVPRGARMLQRGVEQRSKAVGH